MRVTLIALFLAACATKDSPGPGSADGGPGEVCREDADCVVSCVEPDDCCGELCECTQVRHRAVDEQLAAQHNERCEGFDGECPVADCAKPTHDTVPKCRRGACVATQVLRKD